MTNEQIPINEAPADVRGIISAQERLISRFPNSADLIQATVSVLKARLKPMPEDSVVAEIISQSHAE